MTARAFCKFWIVSILVAFFTQLGVSDMSSQGENMLELLANDLLDLEKLTDQETLHFFNENEWDPSTNEIEPGSVGIARFQNVSTEDCEQFIKDNQNKNTIMKTKSDLKIFNDWKITVGEERDLENIPLSDLDNLLARFFLGN